jgi:hypothetical protein
MPHMESALARAAQENPDQTFRVIVRVQGDMDARHAQLQEMGFAITRPLRLVHGFSATANGACLQHASAADWVISIEPDGEMHTMPGDQ